VATSAGNMTAANTGGGQGAGIQASLGGRYATALFELAEGRRAIDAVEQSLARVRDALTQSDDFRRLIASPVINRATATGVIAAVGAELQLDPVTLNFIGVLAQNRRLGQLPQIIRAFRLLASRWRGEVNAEVTSAHPLAPDQIDALKQQLRQRVGREVSVDLAVDPALLGGLVVRIGSQMIDSSIRTRLGALAHAMKVGG